MNGLNVILRLIDNINDWVGKIVAFGCLLMFLLVLAEVIRRYLFNAPTVWMNELTQMVFGVYIVVCAGYVLRWQGHVSVDIFYSRFSTKGKAVADIATFFLFLLFSGMLFFYGGAFAWQSLTRLEHSGSAWNAPIYPIKFMLPVGAFLLLLQGIAKLIRDIKTLLESKDKTHTTVLGERTPL